MCFYCLNMFEPHDLQSLRLQGAWSRPSSHRWPRWCQWQQPGTGCCCSGCPQGRPATKNLALRKKEKNIKGALKMEWSHENLNFPGNNIEQHGVVNLRSNKNAPNPPVSAWSLEENHGKMWQTRRKSAINGGLKGKIWKNQLYQCWISAIFDDHKVW